MQGTTPKKKKHTATPKLNPGWRPGRKKRRRQLAAAMIQKCFRSYLLRRAFKAKRDVVRDSFLALKAFHHARDRHRWRNVDLRRLNREELRLIALSLNLPSTGKKVLLMGRIQRWIDQRVLVNNLAVGAASTAIEKRVRAQGTIYYCEATAAASPIEIRPLRGRNLGRVAAGHESDAVYGIDEQNGSVWLCKTGGLCGQVGLCGSKVDPEGFENPLDTRWLVTPVFMHSLRSEHVVDVQVGRSHAIALAKAGELFSWGENSHGQLGVPALNPEQVARNHATVVAAIATYQCIAVAVGTHHTIASCDQVAGHDGVTFSWGSNMCGQLGVARSSAIEVKASTKQFPKPFAVHCIESLQDVNIRKVSCGALHALAISSDGHLFSWGCRDGGRLGRKEEASSEDGIGTPRRVKGVLDGLIVLEAACGAWHNVCTAAVQGRANEARVFTWGTGIYGQLGAGHTQVQTTPSIVRVPSMTTLDEEFAVHIAAGMHHTAVVTNTNAVYAWGSMDAFSAVPRKLRPADGSGIGKIATIACGRTFTIFSTLSVSEQSYEMPDASRLWRTKEVMIPRLALTGLPSVPLSTSCPGVNCPLPMRLEPQRDRLAREREEQQRYDQVEAINIDAIVHPLCRICWRCNGFQPSPLRLCMCRMCGHEKLLHGSRDRSAPMCEFEAVRKIQCRFRANRARALLQQIREKHYQRVFSIKHDAFFYFNIWQKTASWQHPPEVPEDVEIPIRDPDEMPQIRPPLTKEEATVVLQSFWRLARARKECKRRLRAKYEKHFDRNKGQVYYKTLQAQRTPGASASYQFAILWDEPMLLRRLYDLGEPIEITRLKHLANLTQDEAARDIQRLFRWNHAKLQLKLKMQERVRKLLDEASGQYYYYNVVTKESTWTKPRLLGDDDANDPLLAYAQRTKRVRKETFCDDQAAASTIQALFRRYQARNRLFQLARTRYRKLMDEVSQCPYYYNLATGASSWIKPAIFGQRDLEVETASTAASGQATAVTLHSALAPPRRRHQVFPPSHTEKARIKRERRHMQKLRQCLTPEVAAELIQRAWHARQARGELRALLLQTYEKVFDDVTGHFYYLNKQTGAVSWEKPALLEAEDVRESRRHKRRREYTITGPQEAASVIGCFCRCSLARMELGRLLRARIQKVYDPETCRYYYFDKITGQSAWKKPLVLRDGDLECVRTGILPSARRCFECPAPCIAAHTPLFY